MRYRVVTALIGVGMMSLVCSAQRYTISGYVQDAQSGEALIGANLYVPAFEAGTTTNAFGFYSLTLPADSIRLVVSYVGFQTTTLGFRLNRSLALNIELQPASLEIDAVEVTAERALRIEESSRMSTVDVPITQVQALPALLGETDVLKALQLLPGVQSGSEGTSGLYVRGGGPDQNLILLDGAPVYNASHLFGFFSVFNADAIRSVQLTKGGFPARYGGRLSSVLDINMKEGNLKEFAGSGSLGLVATRLTLEGPIAKDRTSFMVSGRRTYIDLLARPFIKRAAAEDGTDGVAGYYFYDVNAKINHIFSGRDRVYLSLYAGNDQFYVDTKEEFGNYTERIEAGLGWGNLTSSLRWNHVWGNRLFSNTMLTFSRYEFDISGEEEFERPDETQLLRQRYFSGIRDWSGRIDFDFVPSPSQYIKFGVSGIYHTFRPGAAQFKEDITDREPVDVTFKPSEEVDAEEYAAYIEDDIRFSRSLKANIGVHASGLRVGDAFYPALQPRVSMRYLIDDNWALKGSFVTMAQYIHLLTNSGLGLPTDLWLPATDRVKPQRAVQWAAGLARTVGGFEVSVEGYYKQMRNLIEYKEGASFFGLDSDWQDKVEAGDGTAYGAELFIQKKTGRLSGWLGYTLSWSNRQFDNLNFGETFPYRYDRRHDFSTVLIFEWLPNLDIGMTWVYGTGSAISLPVARFQTPDTDIGSSFRHFGEGQFYTSRNGHRLASYHRLDLAINWHRKRRWGERTLSIGAYNTYSRRNPFYLYLTRDGGAFDPQTGEFRGEERVFKQVSLFPIIPSISYRFTF